MMSLSPGVHLATDIYRPMDAGPLSALLLRSPYDKERMLATTAVYANIMRRPALRCTGSRAGVARDLASARGELDRHCQLSWTGASH